MSSPPLSDGADGAASPSGDSSPSTAILILTIVAFSVIVLACIYLLIRHLHRYPRTFPESSSSTTTTATPNASTAQPSRNVSAQSTNSQLQYLPIFEFRSVKGNLTGGDCAVCLTKFEPPDQLRLLPLCCHAFHAECIDAWILSNGTCPLCRSPVFASDQHLFDKMPNRGVTDNITNNNNNNNNYSSSNASSRNNSRSFRIEIGSVSRRENGGATARNGEPAMPRSLSYSLGGAFDYVVSENGSYEVSIGGLSDFISLADKEYSSIGVHIPEPPGEVLAAEVVESGRSWLRDYVDRFPSVSFSSSSFRSSGRFFSGSSRRTDSIVTVEELEASRAGEEISEIFRWLSGV